MKINDEKLMVKSRDMYLQGYIFESDRKRNRNKL